MRCAALIVSTLLLCACGSSGTGSDSTPMPTPTTSTPTPAPTEKGTSLGERLSATLGASGGSLTSAYGRLTLTFPAGALTQDTEIGIEPITNQAPLGIGNAYRLSPDGAKFSEPVTVTFNYTPDELSGSDESALYTGYQSSDGLWHILGNPGLDTALHTVSNQQKHFTDVTALLGWQVSPASASVAPLDSVQLQFKYCMPERFEDTTGGDELSALMPSCEFADLAPLANEVTWSVNGVKGGSIGDGTVTNGGLLVTYQAPLQAPMVNPVTVGCEFTHGKSKTIAVSNVLITDGGWVGTLSWTLMGTLTTSDSMDSYVWTEAGSGMMKVKPGFMGEPALESVNSTFHYSYTQNFHSMVSDGACTRTLIETWVQTADGTSTDLTTSTVSIFDKGDGTFSIIALMPSGMATGHTVVDGRENDTGSGANCTSGTSHSDTATEVEMPSDSFTMDATLDSQGNLTGNTTVHFDDMPPRDYQLSWNFSK